MVGEWLASVNRVAKRRKVGNSSQRLQIFKAVEGKRGGERPSGGADHFIFIFWLLRVLESCRRNTRVVFVKFFMLNLDKMRL